MIELFFVFSILLFLYSFLTTYIGSGVYLFVTPIILVVSTSAVIILCGKLVKSGFKSDLYAFFWALPIFVFTLFINVFTPIMGWDSLALYDFRAKVFLDGNPNMLIYNNLDGFNVNYLYSYPYFTSHLHMILRKIGISNPEVIYSVFYLILCLLFYRIIYQFTNRKRLSAIGMLILALSSAIFPQALVAYTNIPFTLYILFAFYYLYQYIETKSWWLIPLLISSLYVSLWIRILEPYFYIIIAWAAVVSIRKYWGQKLKILLVVLGLISVYLMSKCWFQYIALQTSTTIEVPVNQNLLISAVFNFFMGGGLKVFLTLSSTIINLFLMYILVVVICFVSYFNYRIRDLRSYFWIIVSTVMMLLVFAGMFYSYLIYDWWDQIPGSLVRATLPIYCTTLLQILSFIKYAKEN